MIVFNLFRSVSFFPDCHVFKSPVCSVHVCRVYLLDVLCFPCSCYGFSPVIPVLKTVKCFSTFLSRSSQRIVTEDQIQTVSGACGKPAWSACGRPAGPPLTQSLVPVDPVHTSWPGVPFLCLVVPTGTFELTLPCLVMATTRGAACPSCR